MSVEQLEKQCMSIVMSDLTEYDKKQSLELLIYDIESKSIIENWLQFIS